MIGSKEISRSLWRDECPRFVKIPLDARAARPAMRRRAVQLTDALRGVIVHGGRVLAVPLTTVRRRHDIGSLENYCAAFLEYALRDPRLERSRRARAAQLLDG